MNEQNLALRLKAAAKLLGVSERLLWQLAKDNRVPHVRVGAAGRRGVLLFPVAELRTWLSQQAAKQAAKPEGSGDEKGA